ncbi:MAG: MmcQ/YjbR family DNA-binding protein [Gemmatimonadaceae bacterium]
MPRAPLTFNDVLALCSHLPGVEESTSYGTLAIKVKSKMMIRLKEDGESIVLRTPFVVRDHLMFTQPKVFFITDHYKDYPAVLVNLALVGKKQLKELLEATWREQATPKLIAEYDGQ